MILKGANEKRLRSHMLQTPVLVELETNGLVIITQGLNFYANAKRAMFYVLIITV